MTLSLNVVTGQNLLTVHYLDVNCQPKCWRCMFSKWFIYTWSHV